MAIKWTYEACFEEAKKYETRTQFQKVAYGAYEAALRNGWLNDYSWFISIKKPKGYWQSYENCLAEAKKYNTQNEFRKGNIVAWRESLANGFMDHFTWLSRQIHDRWTQETCFDEAKKYQSRTSFQRGSRGAYKVAAKNGWLDEYTWFKEKGRHNYWTYDQCFLEAKKYTYLGDFRLNCSGAMNAAQKNGWLKDYTWLKKQVHEKWDYNSCFIEAKKYHAITDFAKQNSPAYNAALRHNWLDDYTWMKRKLKPAGYWTQERCFEEAKKYIKKVDFEKQSPSAYNKALKTGWIKMYDWFVPISDIKEYYVYAYEFEQQKRVYVGLTKRKGKRNAQHKGNGDYKTDSPVYLFAKEQGIEIPEPKYLYKKLTAAESQLKEDETINKYKENGWVLLNSGATGVGIGSLGGSAQRWSYNAVREEALKYNSIKDFEEGASGACAAARRNDWIDDFSWLIKQKAKGVSKWTREACYKEAKKYKSRSELKKSPYLYGIILRNGWIDDYTWFERPQKELKWSYNACYEIAKTCRSRAELSRKARGAYYAAMQNGWIDDFNWFVNPNISWTYKKCKEEASKYKTRSEFHFGNAGAYNAAWKNKWLIEFFPHKKKRSNESEELD